MQTELLQELLRTQPPRQWLSLEKRDFMNKTEKVCSPNSATLQDSSKSERKAPHFTWQQTAALWVPSPAEADSITGRPPVCIRGVKALTQGTVN